VTLDERILAYLDGSATAEETAELDRLLDADRAARDRFVRLCEQDAALRQILQVPAPKAKTRRGVIRPVAVGPATPWAAIAFAAAALLFALILAGALSSSSGPAPRPVQFAKPRPVPVEAPPPPPRPEPPPPPAPLPIRPVEVSPKKTEPKIETPIPSSAPPGGATEGKPPPVQPLPPPPAPKPEPVPPPPPPPKTEAIVIVGRLERLKGQVQVLAGQEPTAAKDGSMLPAGQGVQTVGAESAATVRFADAVMEIGGETRVSQITNESGKKIVLDLGSVTAQVSRQPAGQALIFLTPQAEARVLGTKLTLVVSAAETRLEVREGRVKLTRRSDGVSVEVPAGQFAVCSDAVKPVARKIPPPSKPLFVESFDDDSRWVRLEGGFPTTVKGTVEVNLSPRPGDSYDGGGWHASGGLRFRRPFPAPFHLSVDVQVSHLDENLNLLVVFAPNVSGPRTGKNEFALRLRNGEYSLIVETVHKSQVLVPNAGLQRETWTIEVGVKEVALSVKGKEVLRAAHGLAMSPEYVVELQGTAKRQSPENSYVRFDNLIIEP
jgi:FecR-like protein